MHTFLCIPPGDTFRPGSQQRIGVEQGATTDSEGDFFQPPPYIITDPTKMFKPKYVGILNIMCHKIIINFNHLFCSTVVKLWTTVQAICGSNPAEVQTRTVHRGPNDCHLLLIRTGLTNRQRDKCLGPAIRKDPADPVKAV